MAQEKNNKLRWLATDINLNCYTLGVLSLMVNHFILEYQSKAKSGLIKPGETSFLGSQPRKGWQSAQFIRNLRAEDHQK